jgi:hypothetical protein
VSARTPYDLTELLLQPVVKEAADEILRAISQATTLVDIRQCLADGKDRLVILGETPDVDLWDVRLVREVIEREADIQHGAVWPN